MRLKSNFKDYYDHVRFMYYDDRYTYNRVPFPVEDYFDSPLSFTMCELIPTYQAREFARLFVADTHYLVTRKDVLSQWELAEFAGIKNLSPQYFTHVKLPDRFCNEIAKKVGQPVFITKLGFGYNTPDVIEAKIPILAKTGLPAYLGCEQIYQKIEQFLAKTYEDPIPTLTNKEKILSHGFDLKHSFRGK